MDLGLAEHMRRFEELEWNSLGDPVYATTYSPQGGDEAKLAEAVGYKEEEWQHPTNALPLSDETPVALTNSSGDLWTTSVDFANGAIFTLATLASTPDITAINDTTVIIQQTYANLLDATAAVATQWNTRIPLALVKVERVSGSYILKST